MPRRARAVAAGTALGMVGRQGEASFGAATSPGLVLGLALGPTDLGTTLRLLLATQALGSVSVPGDGRAVAHPRHHYWPC